jgi:Na+/glutamate symporter
MWWNLAFACMTLGLVHLAVFRGTYNVKRLLSRKDDEDNPDKKSASVEDGSARPELQLLSAPINVKSRTKLTDSSASTSKAPEKV